MADRPGKRLKCVLETRMRDGLLEGLVEYEDGSREWRAPSSASVEVVNERTGEPVEVSGVKIAGVS